MNGGRPGMTLIEVVVGLSLASIVATIGYATYSTTIDEGARIVAATADTHAAMVRRNISDWLRSAIVIPGSGGSAFRGLDGERDHMPRDEVEFVTRARTPVSYSATIVRLYIDDDSTTHERGLVAELRGWSGKELRRLELDSAVASLDALYRSRLLAEDRALPSWVSSSVLPDRIELRLGGHSMHPLLALPIVTAVGGVR